MEIKTANTAYLNQATTDANGAFTFTIAANSGDYWIHLGGEGIKPYAVQVSAHDHNLSPIAAELA